VGHRSPAQIDKFVKTNAHRLDMSVQYLGDEPNAYLKDWDSATLRTLIFACWNYEAASGNLAIPMVYKVINEWNPDYLADRSYFHSTPKDLKAFESAEIPVFGIESKHQMRDFDLVGTSISYPVLSINFVKQLLMSDIPPTWADRQDSEGNWHEGRHRNPEKWPLVMVGGQCYGAPEVVANVADMVFCGEVEDEPGNPGLGAVMDRIASFKENGVWSTERMECYKALAREFNFLYFPCFFDVHYGYEHRPSVAEALEGFGQEAQPSKQVIGYTSNLPGMKVPILKRFVKDMDNAPQLTNPPLLYNNPSMGAGDMEVQRGCPAWCSFCALTYRQKPFRQRSVEPSIEAAKELQNNTGTLKIAPFGPDFAMGTQKKTLIKGYLENVTDEVDTSSVRVDDVLEDPNYFLLQVHGGMESITVGVEGFSQRMRDLVGKGAADEEVRELTARGIRAGLERFKFYMISSLPGEDEGDVRSILNLARDVANIRDSMGSKARIQFSWTPMLIEGNTPFQWFGPTTPSTAISEAWEELRELNIQFSLGAKAKMDRLVYFQLSQRASREMGMALIEAVAEMNRGCWGGAPGGLRDAVNEALVRRGFLNGFADGYDERQKHDMFGWEMIDQGINPELLWTTYQQMKEFLEETDSKTYDAEFTDDYAGQEWIAKCNERCLGKACGVCDSDDLNLRRKYIQASVTDAEVDLMSLKIVDQSSVEQKVRLQIDKSIEHRHVMNDHHRFGIRRAANRAGVPIAKRTLRFSSDAFKHRDWTCGTDYVEFGLTRKVPEAELDQMLKQMAEEMKTGRDAAPLRLDDWRSMPAKSKDLRDNVDLRLFEIELDKDAGSVSAALQRWSAAEHIDMQFREETRHGGVQLMDVNGKDYVDEMWLLRDGHRLMLRMLVRGRANPYLVYAALFGKKSWIEVANKPAVCKGAFVENDLNVIDFFRPTCIECRRAIPVTVLDTPYDETLCPSCADLGTGHVVGHRVG
jgi:radical SAM superfamily enzyme YgiQ (UPF0313 family)